MGENKPVLLWTYWDNTLWTHSEFHGDILGTKKMQKIQQALTFPKRFFFWIYWVHVAIFHWLSIIFVPNNVFHLLRTFKKWAYLGPLSRQGHFFYSTNECILNNLIGLNSKPIWMVFILFLWWFVTKFCSWLKKHIAPR